MSQLFYNEMETVKTAQDLISKKLITNARDVIHVGLQCFPEAKPLHLLAAQVAIKMNDFHAAVAGYQFLLEIEPNNPEYLIHATNASSHAGNSDTALEYAERFIKVANNKADGLFAKADIYERNNKPEYTIEILENIDEKTRSGMRWKWIEIRVLLQTKQYEKAIDLLLESREEFENSSESHDKSSASFSLFKAYDRLGEYDKAWAAAEKAHELNDTFFDEDTFFGMFDDLESFMSKEMVDALVSGPETEVEPLFIVGNPRSGTSLLEQIMSMHPDIVNGGEMSIGSFMQMDLASLTDSFHSYPMSLLDMRETEAKVLSKKYFDAVEIFRKDEKIVTNKSLALDFQVGFLSKVMPNSRAIMLRRHPLDNAVSCFTTNLISSGHGYTNTLECLGKTLIARKKLTNCYLERLSIPMMELQYESLVDNQREETERIIKFLGLPWAEECMDFHKSKYVARTISYDQVNQKMYTSSKNRWKNYEKHLGPLIDMFSDYI